MSEIRVDKIQAYQDSFSVTIAGITTFSGTGCVSMPGGTSTQRPEVAKKGQIRYINGDVKKGLEFYNGTDWITLGESYIDINAVRSGLVLYLDAGNVKSYSGSGETWFDLSGNSNHGTLINGVGYSSSGGGSLVFDGVNDIVRIPHNSTQNPQNITISSWINLSDFLNSFGRNPNILGKGGNDGYRFRVNGGFNSSPGQVVWFDRGSENIIGTDSDLVLPGDWHFITVTGSSSGLKIYVDDTLRSSNSVPFGGNTTTADLAIGGAGIGVLTNELFVGNIAKVLMYNRELTASEISQNFNAFRDRFGI